MYGDNITKVYMSHNPVNHHYTKHVELYIHFVREKVALGLIRFLHVPSSFPYADIFNEGLPLSLLTSFRSSLGVRSSLASTVGCIRKILCKIIFIQNRLCSHN